MKIVEIEYSRTFNLGDFESEKIALRAQITENETVQSIYEKLNEEVVKLHLLEKKFKIAEKQAKQQALETVKTESVTNFKDIKQALGEDLSKLVHINFSEDKKRIYISPIKFLGKTDFGKLYNIISGTFGGRYISDGANSHFVVYVD